MSQDDVRLTPEELVARWKGAVTTETLSNWRNQRKGPAYVKIGRAVLYPLDQVIAFEKANQRAPGDTQAAPAA